MQIIESSSRLYLVFPLMKGGTLSQQMMKRISTGESFKDKEVAVILYQIVSAVKHIQENKVVHRDLKPGIYPLLREHFAGKSR